MVRITRKAVRSGVIGRGLARARRGAVGPGRALAALSVGALVVAAFSAPLGDRLSRAAPLIQDDPPPPGSASALHRRDIPPGDLATQFTFGGMGGGRFCALVASV